MLTQLRLAVFAAAALGAVSASQSAAAFWPFGADVRLEARPAYGGVCEECDLSGRILTGARMTHSNFSRSDFSNAVLARADASYSRFTSADFTNADLTRSRCRHAIFRGARFHGARMHGADVSGADLRRSSGLTQHELTQACGNQDTLLPPGLSVPPCASVGSN